MTFKRFTELLVSKYPTAEVKKPERPGVYVRFTNRGKRYFYRGYYQDVLNKLGIKVISRARYTDYLACLKWYQQSHGTPNIFGGKIRDNSKEILELSKTVKDIEENYIII